MRRADNFSSILQHELARRVQNYDWHRNWRPVGSGHEAVDVAGTNEVGSTILIEVELRRGHPVANVVKVWKWKDKGSLERDLVFFHAFSKFYDARRRKGKNTRRENAGFVGNALQSFLERFKYAPVSFNFRPGKHGRKGGGAMRRAAQRLARTIARRCKQLPT